MILRYKQHRGMAHREVVEILLEHGANINAKGGNALYAASAGGHTEVVEILLEHGRMSTLKEVMRYMQHQKVAIRRWCRFSSSRSECQR